MIDSELEVLNWSTFISPWTQRVYLKMVAKNITGIVTNVMKENLNKVFTKSMKSGIAMIVMTPSSSLRF